MAAQSERLLLVDDDEAYRAVLARSLTRRGIEVIAVAGPAEAMTACRLRAPEWVILDLNLAGQSGLNLIQPLLQLAPAARILVLTGYASIPTVVAAMKLGAIQYLAKPAGVVDILRALRDEDASPEDLAIDRPMTVRHLEWEYIQRALETHGGNLSATARALGMHRRTLQRKLAKHRLATPPLVP